jgi:hypothetical protein
MIKKLINPAKALRTIRKTPAILTSILHGITQEQAATLRDGEDGWSVLFIICHMRDLEAVYHGRATDLLADEPVFRVSPSNDELAAMNNYAGQDAGQALAEYVSRRRETIAVLEALSDEQWALTGVHPTQGPATMLDVAINIGLHDVDHIEQVIRCLAPIRG